MTDHDALLAAVQLHPQDAIPALMLADHYDELGEPEVGHIVRSSADSLSNPITHYQKSYSYYSNRPHYILDKIGRKENGSIRYAVDVDRNTSTGKASISLIGPPAEDSDAQQGRRLTWRSMEMPPKEAQKLVEGLLDKGHLPYTVPAHWMTKAVNKRIEQAGE